MSVVNDIREQAREIVAKLPADATWDDLMRQIYVRQAVEKGLADSTAGRVTNVKDVRKRFGLQP